MSRRKGSLAMMLLIFLSAILTVAGAFLLFSRRSLLSLSYYEEGLKSVYAAESGANWGLEALKEGPLNRQVTFRVNERIVIVENTEGTSGGKLVSRAAAGNGDYKRYVRISYSLEGREGARKLKVEDVGSDRS
ncbi:hypothetical protein [Dialister sp.]|uniref:hypothetical protein n=1 Tax=Dialister sp. TaxID=1955814 RepID=UPI002E812DA1|nr:hypothetical protein [Dialister sp.]MEE3453534.1 hypothetical protein [Dialister sp.]